MKQRSIILTQLTNFLHAFFFKYIHRIMRPFLFLLLYISANAQNIDYQSIYKMQLFLDSSPYIYKTDQNIAKNDSIYSLYSATFGLKFSVLESNRYYQYFDNFVFLQLQVYDNDKKAFTHDLQIRKEISSLVEPFFYWIRKSPPICFGN